MSIGPGHSATCPVADASSNVFIVDLLILDYGRNHLFRSCYLAA